MSLCPFLGIRRWDQRTQRPDPFDLEGRRQQSPSRPDRRVPNWHAAPPRDVGEPTKGLARLAVAEVPDPFPRHHRSHDAQQQQCHRGVRTRRAHRPPRRGRPRSSILRSSTTRRSNGPSEARSAIDSARNWRASTPRPAATATISAAASVATTSTPRPANHTASTPVPQFSSTTRLPAGHSSSSLRHTA